MTRKLKFKIDLNECNLCGGVHAHWWFTSKVRAPSCEERRKRNGK